MFSQQRTHSCLEELQLSLRRGGFCVTTCCGGQPAKEAERDCQPCSREAKWIAVHVHFFRRGKGGRERGGAGGDESWGDSGPTRLRSHETPVPRNIITGIQGRVSD